MHRTSTLKRHAALVDRMATTLGVDLEETMLRGEMTTDTLSDAVLRCTGCACTDTCDQWMDGKQAEATPDYCRNADLLNGLRG